MGAELLLFIVGLFVVAGSLGGVALAHGVSALNEGVTIDSGWDHYVVFNFDLFGGGRLSGKFAEYWGQLLEVYLFNDAQYVAYRHLATSGHLWNTTSASGNISVELPWSGGFHLVFAHGLGHSGDAEFVQLSVRVDGFSGTGLLISLTFLTVGVIVVVAGVVFRELRRRHPT